MTYVLVNVGRVISLHTFPHHCSNYYRYLQLVVYVYNWVGSLLA